MEKAQQETASEPQLCVEGCGFFGNSETGNMCSKCFKEKMSSNQMDVERKEAEQPREIPAEIESQAKTEISIGFQEVSESVQANVETSVTVSAPDEAKPSIASLSSPRNESKRVAETFCEPTSAKKKSRKRRCAMCNKKVGLTAFTCKCEGLFCSLHRYPECHDCQFDFKAAERAVLAESVTGGGQFERITKI